MSNQFQVAQQAGGLAYVRRLKNTICPGRALEPAVFSMHVCEHGILVNGDYGTNPSREEMREMLDAMRELVADWDKRYGVQPREFNGGISYEGDL